MDSRPPNSTLLVAFVKFDKFDHDFYTFFALILHDLALSVVVLVLEKFMNQEFSGGTCTHNLGFGYPAFLLRNGLKANRTRLFFILLIFQTLKLP